MIFEGDAKASPFFIDNELNKEINSLLNNYEIYYIKANNEIFMKAYNNLQPKLNNLNKYDLINDEELLQEYEKQLVEIFSNYLKEH